MDVQRLNGCVTHVMTQVLTQAEAQKMTEQISQSNNAAGAIMSDAALRINADCTNI